MKYSSLFLSLNILLSTTATLQALEIPTQERQITVLSKWKDSGFSRDPRSPEYCAVQKLTLGENFPLIRKTVAERFGPDSFKSKEFEKVCVKAKQRFETQTMTPQKLRNYYWDSVVIMDKKPIFLYEDELFNIPPSYPHNLIPLPVLSQTGTGTKKAICDGLAEGFYYLGVPLNERVRFDSTTSGPVGFFDHDVGHAKYAGSKEDVERTLPLLKKFNKDLFEGVEDPENSMERFIQFEAEHDGMTGVLMTLATLLNVDENSPEDYSKWAIEVLKLGKLDSGLGLAMTLAIYREDAKKAVARKLLPSVPGETDRERTKRFVETVNRKVDSLIEQLTCVEGSEVSL